MTEPNAPPPESPPPIQNEGPLTEAKPKKPDEKTWLQALGITVGVILGAVGAGIAVLAVVALAVVGLVLWTCSSH